jgi:muramoyltetrapeptide carboxypeptidase
MKISFNKATDYIQIVAPASNLIYADKDSVLQQAVELLAMHGFKVKISPDILTKEPVLFYANTLKKRVEDFEQAMQDDEVKIIWCLRGGYGSAEVANSLLDIAMTAPKILIGFSDITSLHVFFEKKFLMPSIHGNNINSLLKQKEGTSLLEETQSINQIIELLSGKISTLPISPINSLAKNSQKIEGIITGGNLRVLTTLIGTPLTPNLDDKILILEDVSEAGYSIMRALMQLKHANLLAKTKAIIFGDFIKSDAYCNDVLQTFADEINIPVFRTKNFGHDEENTPITLGVNCIIETDKQVLSVYSPFEIIDLS